jgi:hypothetical protein
MNAAQGIRLGIVRGISYGLFGRPDEFAGAARALGAGLLRAYVYWGQVEPEPGRYVWDTVDALMAQFDGGSTGDPEVWITVCSSSPWATRQPTDFLPPSPAHDQTAYGDFVRALVRRCGGRVRYWQCDNEPSNTGLLWAGTAEEYVTQLQTMYGAVKDADPAASVVLGGCGYDVFSSPEGSEPRRFFDHLASAGRDRFDVFDVHLYGDPRQDRTHLDTARQIMRAHGYEKPIVVGEHAGPVPFQFPEVEAALQQVFLEAFSEAPATQSTAELQERAGQETPERRAMTTLYAKMPDLPPALQMFLAGCPAELAARRDRINCRQVVMHTVQALAEGVRRTAYWNLAPEVPGATDPYQTMHLMFGKLPLLDYEDGTLGHRYPAADAFARLAKVLAGADTVTRVEAPPDTLRVFHVARAGRDPVLVLWDERDPFDGEDQPAVPVSWPWPAGAGTVVDALGGACPAEVRDGRLHLEVSDTPVFVTD